MTITFKQSGSFLIKYENFESSQTFSILLKKKGADNLIKDIFIETFVSFRHPIPTLLNSSIVTIREHFSFSSPIISQFLYLRVFSKEAVKVKVQIFNTKYTEK